jgi:hypothetical protein
MKDVLDEVGIQVTKDNKKEIDRVIHEMVGVSYKDCSPAWKAIKAQIKGDEQARRRFIQALKKGLGEP